MSVWIQIGYADNRSGSFSIISITDLNSNRHLNLDHFEEVEANKLDLVACIAVGIMSATFIATNLLPPGTTTIVQWIRRRSLFVSIEPDSIIQYPWWWALARRKGSILFNSLKSTTECWVSNYVFYLFRNRTGEAPEFISWVCDLIVRSDHKRWWMPRVCWWGESVEQYYSRDWVAPSTIK